MLDHVLERDREEALRTTTRVLDFPDGTTRKVEAYRVVWRWFDHLCAYEFAADAPEILGYAQKTMAQKNYDEGEALALVVDYLVTGTEERGGDVTDDNPALMLAKSQMDTWRQRKDTGTG